jgi:hypothetical protein
MRNWIEKNYSILKLVLAPLALIIGLGLISYFGIETKAHALETYVSKTEQEKTTGKIVTALERLDKLEALQNKRQIIDRKHIVALNHKHGIPTEDYPIE